MLVDGKRTKASNENSLHCKRLCSLSYPVSVRKSKASEKGAEIRLAYVWLCYQFLLFYCLTFCSKY